MKFVSLLLVSAALSGCAGYRGGWESVAYVGDAPPEGLAEARTAYERANRPVLSVPGLELQVRLDNLLRTYDTKVYFFVVPLEFDPRHVYPLNHVPGRTRVSVTVTPATAGFVFRPSAAILRIGDQTFAGTAGYEFGGGHGHRPVGEAFALHEPGRRYLLSIDFATPVPSPESRDIVLDLSRALASPAHPALPPIRFTPVRWKEGYT